LERLGRELVGGSDLAERVARLQVTVTIGGRRIALARAMTRLTLASRVVGGQGRCAGSRC